MTRKFWMFCAVAAVAVGIACTKSSQNLSSPSSVGGGGLGAAADGTTLKASAPTPVSPLNGVKLDIGVNPVLVINNSTLQFSTASNSVQLTYRFRVFNAAGAIISNVVVPSGSGTTTSYTVTAPLDGEQIYTWDARAEYSGTFTAYTSRSNARFETPASTGYIKANEVYDPLINGKTVGVTHGAVSWMGAQGAKLEDYGSYIHYELAQTLDQGEFSMIIGNIKTYMSGSKTKVFSMSQGFDDIITNEYRMTVEKRGGGEVAWRFIARDDQIDTEGAERVVIDLDRAHEYLWKATWRANRFQLDIWDAPSGGRLIYSMGKHWDGRGYVPSPHVAFVGAPTGRSGADSATVPGMVVRQVYLGPGTRPANSNQ
jgi:hypothetical protein